MPIPLSTLRAAATQEMMKKAMDLNESKVHGAKSMFLCHSHRDRELALGFVNLVQEEGWDVYIDWQDAHLPEVPNAVTALAIRKRINSCAYFVFLATPNSVASRWCPWEIGLADGLRDRKTILVVPTSDNFGTHGNEYLELYRKVDISAQRRLGVWEPGQTQGVLLSSL